MLVPVELVLRCQEFVLKSHAEVSDVVRGGAELAAVATDSLEAHGHLILGMPLAVFLRVWIRQLYRRQILPDVLHDAGLATEPLDQDIHDVLQGLVLVF